jgi:hypothetical protein
VDAEERIIRWLARKAYEDVITTGFSGFFDESFSECASEVEATEADARRARRRMLNDYLLDEPQPRFFRATPALLLLHEAFDRRQAYRQNEVRRFLLKEAASVDGDHVVFKAEGDDPYPAAQMFAAAFVLDYLGLVDVAGKLPAIFDLTVTSKGHDAVADDRLLVRQLPVTASEDAEHHTLVAPDALGSVITSCEEMLRSRGWLTALDELQRGDAQYAEEDWVNAVREYYSALESGLKHALHDQEERYGEGSALKKLSANAAQAGLIPRTYQAMFEFTDSVRSPRSHGGGPSGPAPVEIGQAEALLMGNHVRSLLLYLGQRPELG